MPSTTAIYGLPYPLPTEPVAEGAAAIRALADRLEALGGLGSIRVLRAQCSAAINFTTVLGVITGTVINVTLTRASLAVLLGVFDLQVPNNVIGVGRIIANATPLPGQALLSSTTAGTLRSTVGQVGVISLAAGAHQFNLGGQTAGGTVTCGTDSILTVALLPGGLAT